MARIYVASSWRNNVQQQVVECLIEKGHKVYDFKNPPNGAGFGWEEICRDWKEWNTKQFKEALQHPRAVEGFNADLQGMNWADICVLVLPCGRSAHTEAGWMKGSGKPVFVYQPGVEEPELMYKLYDDIFSRMDDLLDAIQNIDDRVLPLQMDPESTLSRSFWVEGLQVSFSKNIDDDDEPINVISTTCEGVLVSTKYKYASIEARDKDFEGISYGRIKRAWGTMLNAILAVIKD